MADCHAAGPQKSLSRLYDKLSEEMLQVPSVTLTDLESNLLEASLV